MNGFVSHAMSDPANATKGAPRDPAYGATKLDLLCINTLRTLSIDMVQRADSGHPGTSMGAAPTAYCLWQRFLRYDPNDPDWPNRDRFVLSVGHASALLYSLLYLCGVKAKGSSDETSGPASGEERDEAANGLAVTLADLQSFRQAGSRCTGHPEYGWTAGVETTTGPLGQGVATSVGMAVAQAWLAATYNRPGFELFDHRVYALCGDGDMMEGISSEAASLAGHLKLARLCWIYDANHISIEGSTQITFTEDVGARFEAYGWKVVRVADANDLEAVTRGLQTFVDTDDRPTLIVVQSHIGYGAPHKHDTREAHGEALGVEEVRLAKQFYGFDPGAQFAVPEGVQAHFRAQFGQRGAQAHAGWRARFEAYRAQYPDLARQIEHMQRRELPDGWDRALPSFKADTKGLATRDSSGQVLNAIAAQMPWLLGGAADLAPSTKTRLGFAFAGEFQPHPSRVAERDASGGACVTAGDCNRSDGRSYQGRNLHFGVREHAMCAIASGMSLSKLRPFVASFFIFTDYCRGAIRLSAMMGLPVIYIWTHDSISMGEDGPTHQPIEQLSSFRAMPGMVLLRPADANEVVEAWKVIMQTTDRPVSLVLTRQALPTLDRDKYASASGLSRGAYVLADPSDGKPEVLLIATGSEVALCVTAHEQLAADGIRSRVVSLPSWELFESQSEAYRDSVLPPEVTARVTVEEGSTFGWERYAGPHGSILGISTFGLSAPLKVVARHFGFEPARVVAAAREQLARRDAKQCAGADLTTHP
ncbi:MAG: transketolase [Burkholderiaceae bacterium]